ncbi:uncharacterized protein NMK_1181 [Novimethylophilus kurashikiensis]|uniref:Uncharacterized protein n=1 Tax=Novimethylophilus kurashikiensis TaxID=1825523 RepID=A0A2R5F5L4_9PROT|nr:hypothetical protein [Novimethylophilus kurashikiensis]GBG13630.1 uncharacterized protein NMK_1181 [Novimethylophilus kurashikiensis]
MTKLKTTLLALALGLTGTAAQAHDSVGFSLNIGVPGYYAAPPVYYAPPPPVYYSRPPVVYYEPGPPVIYTPRASFGFYDAPRRWHRDHDDDHGWRHHHRWHDDD